MLDESESVIAQEQHLRTGENLKRRKQTLAKFEYLVKHSWRIIAMDALVGSRTYSLLHERNALLHHNEYQSGKNLTYHKYTDKGQFTSELFNAIAAGKRVVFCSSSIRFLKAIVDKVRVLHPDKSLRVYTSESTEEERRDFTHVNTAWTSVDILAYSPMLTAGVSFEEAHFDTLFAYFSDKSCSYNQCIQMMGRVRQLSTNTRHVYLKTRRSNLPESPTAYVKFLSRALSEDPVLIQHYDENGSPAYTLDDFESHVYVHNQCAENRSRNRFSHLFWKAVTDMGSKVEANSDENEEMSTELSKMVAKVTQEEHTSVALAPTLIPEEADVLYVKETKTEEEKHALRKYGLCKMYESTMLPSQQSLLKSTALRESKVYTTI